MYKMDKTVGKGMSFAKAEKQNLFPKDTTVSDRLSQSWYLTCMAYGIDPLNPPKMDKTVGSSRKHAL